MAFATVLLGVTLASLGRYERTDTRGGYGLFTLTALLGWLGLFGLFMGGYNYLLKNILSISGAVSSATLSSLFPSEHIPPTDFFHEGSGILMFLFAVWVGGAWRQLAIQRWHERSRADTAFKAEEETR